MKHVAMALFDRKVADFFNKMMDTDMTDISPMLDNPREITRVMANFADGHWADVSLMLDNEKYCTKVTLFDENGMKNDSSNAIFAIFGDEKFEFTVGDDVYVVKVSMILEDVALKTEYAKRKTRCCACGCSLEDMSGAGLGACFTMDRGGNFYCTNCDWIFNDEFDERVYVED